MAIYIVCNAANDLPGVLRENAIGFEQLSSLDDALRSAQDGDGVLVLADQYPNEKTMIAPQSYSQAESKGVRLYVEFPAALGDGPTGDCRDADWERIVVSCDLFGKQLDEHRILMAHQCRWVSTNADNPILVSARVAGFDHAIFGLPDETCPILFEHTENSLLVATTKLSNFMTARYAPSEAWGIVWAWILRWADPSLKIDHLKFSPSVKPSYQPDEAITSQTESDTIQRGVDWFSNAKLFVDSSWKDQAEERLKTFHDGTGQGPDPDWPVGDGSCGMIEGASGQILPDGKQNWRYFLRADCMGEASMALGMYSHLKKSDKHQATSANLIKFVLEDSSLASGPAVDPNDPSFGLLGWYTTNSGTYYGDDNARAILGMITAASAMETDRWNEQLLRSIIANFRTTGPNGYRESFLTEEQLTEKGWNHYFEGEFKRCSPHFESWLWACYLWAYKQTGYEPFLVMAKSGISMMMEAYPDQWSWTNGLQQERARMLLPLAWLVRVEDTPQHREYLDCILSDILKFQDEHGGIIEEIGDLDRGTYAPPKSNEEYGKKEAPLIQTNEDRLCDLLYTTNFAFIGLHEAAGALQDSAVVVAAENKLADFLCRIQVSADKHPELDGAWFRAFDLQRWDYWASNGDLGWGAWSIETGWTQSWIVSTLMLRQMNTSLWDFISDSKINQHSKQLLDQMLS